MSDDPKSNSPADVGYTPAPPRKVTFEIPEGTPERACSSCRAPIFWIVTAAGKHMPVDADGTSHFATCPNAAQHRRNR